MSTITLFLKNVYTFYTIDTFKCSFAIQSNKLKTSNFYFMPNVHPHYNLTSESQIAAFASSPTTLKAFDSSVAENELFYCKRIHSVMVNYGTDRPKKRHFFLDKNLVAVQEGGETVYYANKEVASLDGYKFSARLKMWAKETCSSFYGRETQLGYHASADAGVMNFTKEGDKYKVGVEVEKEDERYNQLGLAWKLFQDTGWARERDGSLGNGGFELVSPIMPMDDIERIKEICAPVKQMINGNVSSNCGGHFNISCEGMTNTDLMKQIKLFVPILYSLYKNRLSNRYCQMKSFDRYSHDKYAAICIKGSEVVEIRLFPAIKSVSNLVWRVRLMQILFRRKNCNFATHLKAMVDTRSKLHGHLRKIFTYEQVIAKAQLAFQLWRSDSSLYNQPMSLEIEAILQGVEVFQDNGSEGEA